MSTSRPMVKQAPWAICILLCSGCVTPLSPQANSLSVTVEEPANCKFIGYVSAQASSITFSSPARASARNDVINAAAARGADTVQIVGPCEGIYSASCNGKAYRCDGASEVKTSADKSRTGDDTTAAQLKEIIEMKNKGLLTDEEFNKAKAKILK